MNFGFNADPDIVPNVDLFAEMMRRSLERLAKEAGVTLSEPQAPPKTTGEPAPAPVELPAEAASEGARVNGNGSAAAAEQGVRWRGRAETRERDRRGAGCRPKSAVSNCCAARSRCSHAAG
jgi:hypothetical protein